MDEALRQRLVEYGRKYALLRTGKHWKVTELAHKVGSNGNVISKFEHGNELPSIAVLYNLCTQYFEGDALDHEKTALARFYAEYRSARSAYQRKNKLELKSQATSA